jgi:hypothetical protein
MRQDRLQRVVRPPRPTHSLPHTAVPATPVLSSDPIAARKMAISINIWPVMQYCLPHTAVPATPVLSSGPIAAGKWLVVLIFGHYLPVMQYCLLHTAVPATLVLSSGPIAARKMAFSINIWTLLASHAVLPASYCSPSHTRLELQSHYCKKNGY